MLRTALLATAFVAAATTADAAKVSCNFSRGESYVFVNVEGSDLPLVVWAATEPMDIWMLMDSEDLTVELDNSLVSKLDSKEVFYAGRSKYGNIFIRGTDRGVQGKMVASDEKGIIVWGGRCKVGFGG